MALRLALRKTAATSNLLNRLINRGNRVPIFSSSPRATYFTRSSDTVGVYTHPYGEEFRRCLEFPVNRGSVDANMDNPFQVTGPRGWYEVKRVDEGLFVRIDMPGIAKEDVKVSAEYGNLYITGGQGRKESALEAAGRGYNGRLEFPAHLFREKDLKHELKNGVLRVFIPKSSNKVII